VLVVGGGPAGSTAARVLTRAGVDVVVVDRQEFPRDKVCAGWITPAVAESLGLDLADYAAGRTLQPIHAFRVGGIGAEPVATRRRDAPISYGIRRCEFDDYLLRRSGAELRLGRPLPAPTRVADGWQCGDELQARLLVGAGGHFCPVARMLGAKRGETVVAAQEIEFRMTPQQSAGCPVEPSVPELAFCADLAGYGWVFRKGDWLNVGLGREGGSDLKAHVAAFRAALIAAGRIPAETPERFHGHAYLLRGRARRRVVDDGVLLVGDAAGLAWPQSGEGIRPAVESALLAARVVLAAGVDAPRAALEPYARALERRFGPASARNGLAARVPGRLKQALAAALLRREWFVRRVVLERWFLHQELPLLRPA